MTDATDQPTTGPIAIGGLGGSGTRVFAASLQHAGLTIGQDLNKALDNLWFTVLFKRKRWAQETPDPADVAISVDLFRRAMTTGLTGNMTAEETALIQSLADDLPPDGPWICGARSKHAEQLIASDLQPGGRDQPWGWKEPNTHLFLPELNAHIPDLRYIHVVRNGLDMSFSKNTWQADHWAHHYELPSPDTNGDPVHQLRYWIAANQRAIAYLQRAMPGRYLLIDYDDFCMRPDIEWPRLQQFFGRPTDTPIPEGFIVKTSIGRSDAEDLSVFPPDLMTAYRSFQKEVAALTNQ
ncbi:sulfotransferase [Planktotalea sp.]|uniref:sulfotransferase n=1 Tax=Planktotalea sp. TaxID=2029877 RepID=UPI003299E427